VSAAAAAESEGEPEPETGLDYSRAWELRKTEIRLIDLISTTQGSCEQSTKWKKKRWKKSTVLIPDVIKG
jgi:hypothetical protein